jgi:hypothetical protein
MLISGPPGTLCAAQGKRKYQKQSISQIVAVVYIAAISFRDQGHFSTSSFSLNLHFKNTIHQHA